MDEDRKDTTKKIVFLAIGAALAFLSFFLYLYPERVSLPVIIVLCVLDFAYSAVNAFLLTDEESNRLLKTVIILIIYYALFNAAPFFYFLFTEALGTYVGLWQDILLYSIFCGPALILVILLVSLLLILFGIANGHGI